MRTKFRERRIQAIREHLIFANRGGSKLSKTFYGIEIGQFGAKLQHFKVAPPQKKIQNQIIATAVNT